MQKLDGLLSFPSFRHLAKMTLFSITLRKLLDKLASA